MTYSRNPAGLYKLFRLVFFLTRDPIRLHSHKDVSHRRPSRNETRLESLRYICEAVRWFFYRLTIEQNLAFQSTTTTNLNFHLWLNQPTCQAQKRALPATGFPDNRQKLILT